MQIDRFRGEYRFLSNFHTDRDGWNVECYYQAAKAVTREDYLYVMASPTAAEAKVRGSEIVLRPDWEDVRIPIMRELLEQKFSNEVLAAKLVATGDAELIEGNFHHDTLWGFCFGNPAVCGKHKPTGENLLGQLLMDIRDRLKEYMQEFPV